MTKFPYSSSFSPDSFLPYLGLLCCIAGGEREADFKQGRERESLGGRLGQQGHYQGVDRLHESTVETRQLDELRAAKRAEVAINAQLADMLMSSGVRRASDRRLRRTLTCFSSMIILSVS